MARTCKVCKIKFDPQYNSVQPTCSIKCAIEYSNTNKKIKQAKVDKQINELIKEKKAKNTLETLKKSIMNVCHKYIRLRDEGKPCVSCGQPWNSNHQAGHWKKASDYSNLKYNEFNIFNQCQGCNLMKDGNVQKYGDRITLRISKEQKQEIEQLAADYKKDGFKWDRLELIKIREYYNSKIKELKRE